MGSKAEAIEQYLIRIIEGSDNDMVELRRADLSLRFSCVPSQINYVLNTRFTLSQGYVVESRRGGGGYLRIVKLPIRRGERILELLGDERRTTLTEQEAKGLMTRLVREGFFTPSEGRLALALMDADVLVRAGTARDAVRLDLMKALVVAAMREGKHR